MLKKNIEITGGTVNLTSTADDAIFAGGSVSISGDNTQVILNGSQGISCYLFGYYQ